MFMKGFVSRDTDGRDQLDSKYSTESYVRIRTELEVTGETEHSGVGSSYILETTMDDE